MKAVTKKKSMTIIALSLLSMPCAVLAETLLKIDASAAAVLPLEGHFRQGSAVSPAGVKLGINSQYLTRNGQPWLPVMGEFHYTRTPASQWESELRKMKAAGVDVVASYVIWNHHEEQEGKFDWSGRRDLRHFVELCKKVGLQTVMRIGPWAHAEVRFGGTPDWVVYTMPTRRNDPQYMQYVERLYGQIGKQLQGLMWKDGGPIIAIQLENEYNLRGEGKGAEHISALKKLALKVGLDAPLYTVTGWDGAVYPAGEVTPVFGGYADEPWAASASELPPKETHAFRFDTRVSGDLGAQTQAFEKGTADEEIDKTPFFGAEYGSGVPFMYRRRPIVSPDDIASMIPVQIGSGVNLLGYYMFHGGRNPEGRTWLQESTGMGGYNDMPLISYDFQAPLGPDGQQRPMLGKLRPYHWMLQNFGDRLARMTVRKPDAVPAAPTDLKTPRWSVRSYGNSGFVFFNNHVRQYPMAPQNGVRFSVKLPAETLVFPSKPVDIADGDYFVWPYNFDLDGTLLRHASAQPVARLDQGRDGVVYVFAAHKNIPAEFAFDPALAATLKSATAKLHEQEGKLIVDGLKTGLDEAFAIQQPGGRTIRVILLDAAEAEKLVVAELDGQRRLILSEQQVVVQDKEIQLRSLGQAALKLAVYPALSHQPSASNGTMQVGKQGLFQTLAISVPERRLSASMTQLRAAEAVPPVLKGGSANAAVEPGAETFKSAATWRIDIPKAQLKGLDDALLNIDFVGDVGRLYSGLHMLDDWYYSGYGWQYGLRQIEGALDAPLTLSVLPLRSDAPVYIPREGRPDFGGKSQIAQLRQVSLTPVYRVNLKLK